MPLKLRSEIIFRDSVKPIVEYNDYLSRVFKNQLIKHFGFDPDNPYTKFY